MKKYIVVLLSLLMGIGMIVGGFLGREWVLTPKTEFTYSVYARNAAVDYGLDNVDTSMVASSSDELVQHYLAGVEGVMQNFAYKYSSTFGITEPKELLTAIQSDHKKVQLIPFEDRDIVVFGWSIADLHTNVLNNPGILVHRGYLPFTPEIWGNIFIGVMVIGLAIVIQATLHYLQMVGATVPIGFKEATYRAKDKLNR